MTNKLEERIRKIVKKIKSARGIGEDIFVFVENWGRDSMSPAGWTLKLATHNYADLTNREIEEKLTPKVVNLAWKIKDREKRIHEEARRRVIAMQERYKKKE